jgi:death-on-curing protein
MVIRCAPCRRLQGDVLKRAPRGGGASRLRARLLARAVRAGRYHLEDLLHIAERTLGHAPHVRDYGLLESALTRPRATAFGEDAYPDIHRKAAALLHSLARNHALADDNKRLALAALLAFHGMNGLRVTLTNDDAYNLVIGVAAGQISDVTQIAAVLERGTAAR